MENVTLPTDYLLAEGPEGLRQRLDELLEKAQAEPSSAEFYILYQLANQKSLLKIDMTQKPYQFWYYDLLGRPATKIVKDIIAQFLWEKCGEKEQYLKELTPGE